MRVNFDWWTRQQNLLRCHTLFTMRWQIVQLDASGTGWGALYKDHWAQGHWTFQTANVGSNILELRAAFQALLAFKSQIQGAPILL